MSGSNSWAEFAGIFRSTRSAFLKSGAISFDLLEVEGGHAALQ